MRVPKFEVNVTGETNLKLPIDTTELTAECNPVLPLKSKWSYKYKWTENRYEAEGNSSLSKYKPCDLEEGDYFYTVSVWCSNNKNENLFSEEKKAEVHISVRSGKV